MRRKFVEAQKAGAGGKTTAAHWALARIRKLYEIERRAQAKGLRGEALVRERQEQAVPVLKELKAWL
ncbi:IS66 family transposase, partial [Deferrisoma palaeochoriense]